MPSHLPMPTFFPLPFSPNPRHPELLSSFLTSRALLCLWPFAHSIPSALKIHKHSWPHSNWRSPPLQDHFLNDAAFTPQTSSCLSESPITPLPLTSMLHSRGLSRGWFMTPNELGAHLSPLHMGAALAVAFGRRTGFLRSG